MQATALKTYGSGALGSVPELTAIRLQAVLAKLGVSKKRSSTLKISPSARTPKRGRPSTSERHSLLSSTPNGSASLYDVTSRASPLNGVGKAPLRRPNILKRTPSKPTTPQKGSAAGHSPVSAKSSRQSASGDTSLINGLLHHHINSCHSCHEVLEYARDARLSANSARTPVQISDQHLLIFCDTCKHHYHLACLDPPLKRMPILRKAETFECADCYCPSSSDEEDTGEDMKRQILVNCGQNPKFASNRHTF